MTWMARQGDVLVMATKKRPTKAHAEVPRVGGRVILADGNATGHAHAIAGDGAKLFSLDGESDRLLFLEMPATLSHEEHGPIDLAAGSYLVRRQLEWADEEMRQVQD